MPAPEIDEWKVYCERNPLPDFYWIGAQICHVIYAMNRGKGSPQRSIEDFIPRLRPARVRQTPEEMRAVFLQATKNCK